jgi:hypothetical protein
VSTDLSKQEGAPVDTGQSGPECFFDEALQAFESAEGKMGGPVERFFRIGGYCVRLRFAGQALVPLITRAMMHLVEQNPAHVDLTICLWDSVSTGVRMVPPAWQADDNGVRGEIRGFNTPMVRTTFNLGSGILSVLHKSKDIAVYWTRDSGELPYWESGAPLLTILNWWMGAHGRQIVHAGAVGNPDGAILLVGKGGSGKSSTSLSCLVHGLSYLSDDYCLVATKPAPFVYSIFSSGKVNPEDAKWYPSLNTVLSNARRLGPEKALFFLNEEFTDRILTGMPLKAILIPRVTGRPETRLVKVSRAASLLALAPSTIFQLPGAGHDVFNCLRDLTAVLPSYLLELGTERAKIPGVISRFLAEGKE